MVMTPPGYALKIQLMKSELALLRIKEKLAPLTEQEKKREKELLRRLAIKF